MRWSIYEIIHICTTEMKVKSDHRSDHSSLSSTEPQYIYELFHIYSTCLEGILIILVSKEKSLIQH